MRNNTITYKPFSLKSEMFLSSDFRLQSFEIVRLIENKVAAMKLQGFNLKFK